MLAKEQIMNKFRMEFRGFFRHHKHGFLEQISIRNSRGRDQVIFLKNIPVYERLTYN